VTSDHPNTTPNPFSLTISTDSDTQTITPAPTTGVARRDTNEDIDICIERHGFNGLTVALEYAAEYVNGTVNNRVAAREPDLSPLKPTSSYRRSNLSPRRTPMLPHDDGLHCRYWCLRSVW